MEADRLEKLLALILLNLAEARGEISGLRALLLETTPENPELLARVAAAKKLADTAALDLLTMTSRTEGLLAPLDWAIRQRFPEQAG